VNAILDLRLLGQNLQALRSAAPWLVLLAVVLLLAVVAVVVVRKWMGREPTASGAPFSLAQLRELHKQGQLTQEEFERAKAVIIGRTMQQPGKQGQAISDIRQNENPPE
jgi:hypothetical protein